MKDQYTDRASFTIYLNTKCPFGLRGFSVALSKCGMERIVCLTNTMGFSHHGFLSEEREKVFEQKLLTENSVLFSGDVCTSHKFDLLVEKLVVNITHNQTNSSPKILIFLKSESATRLGDAKMSNNTKRSQNYF